MSSPSSNSSTRTPMARRRAATAPRRSLSLTLSSAASRSRETPRARAAASAQMGSSSINRGMSAPPTSTARSSLDRARTLPIGSGPGTRLGHHLQAGAHALEHVQQAGSSGVEPHAGGHQVRPGHQQGGHQEEGGRAQIGRYDDPVQVQRVHRGDVHHVGTACPGLAQHLGAGVGDQPFGMVAGRRGLHHRRLAPGAQPGQQYAGLHLGGRDRHVVDDPAQRSASQAERREAVARPGPDGSAHLPQGLEHPGHGTAADAGVAGEHGQEGPGGQQAREQADQGAGVGHVDDVLRLAQTLPTPAVDEEVAVPFLDDDPQGPHGGDRGQRVGRGQETGDAAGGVADCPQQHRPVGDGLVSGDADLAAQPPPRRGEGATSAGWRGPLADGGSILRGLSHRRRRRERRPSGSPARSAASPPRPPPVRPSRR